MDLLTFVLTLPLAPVRGVIAVAELLRDEAERELYDPSRVRRQLENVRAAVAAGELSEQEGERREREIVGRLVVPADPGAAQPRAGTEEA